MGLLKNRRIAGFSAALIAAVLIFSGASAPAFAAGEEKLLVPMGNAVGINMMTEGVIVVGTSDISTETGTVAPARDAGIVAGDIITGIAGHKISSGSDLTAALGALDGKSDITVSLRRDGRSMELTVSPYKPPCGVCELGLWLKDGMTGIGTMTFYDPETRVFGALGHSISDADSGMLMPLREGSVLRSEVTDVIPGKAGSPGQLLGSFDIEDDIGSLSANSSCGIFGTMDGCDLTEAAAIPAADEDEIKVGKATILTNVFDDTVSEYDIEITRVYTGDSERTVMIHVTDPDLISRTGGIVQGMSGSPILQNGKLIGAVTHVLIDDPCRGYGISVERMLATAETGCSLNAA